MIKIIICSLVLSNLFSSEYINYGIFKNDDSIFLQKDIVKLSEKFLNVKYVSNTLSNYEIDTSKENLIINFNSLDCFTFIDTIEALKSSKNKEQFKNTLAQADEELDLGLDLSDLQVHDIFLTKLHHTSTRHRALDIIQAIQNKTDIDISNIDTVEQAYLSAWIEENNKFVVVPQSNSFFKSTGEIMRWLQTYPEHYKAMNPNLPKFNGIPNPFHLWNLKK